MSLEPRSLPEGDGLSASLLDAFNHGVIVVNAQQRVLLWSGWLEKVSGIPAQTAVGRTLLENFPELADSRVHGAVEAALIDGFPSVISQSLNKSPFPLFGKLTPKGQKQRIQQKINVLPLRRDSDVPCCLIEIFDVSLSVHREKILEEQKSFLNTILDSEPECVMVLASDGSFVQINKAGLAMLEVERLEQLGGRVLQDFMLTTHSEKCSEMLRKVFAGDNVSFEFKLQGAGGTRRWVDTKATPLRDKKGQIMSLLGVARDTTARRQAEATTRALIDATHETAMLLDRGGRILAINQVAAKRLGASLGTLSGQNFFSLMPPDVAQSHREVADRVFSTGKPAFLQDARNGSHFDINVYPVFDSAGGVVSIAVYAADVTERLQQLAVDRLFHEMDQQILRGQSKPQLFNFVCAEVARIFDFAFTWIGAKKGDGSVSLAAWGGEQGEYFADMHAVGLRWDDTPLGQGPSGRAIRLGQTQGGRSDDPAFSPWQVVAKLHDVHTYHSIPLILRGEVFACFTAVSRRNSTFNQPMIVTRLADIASRICVAQERANDHEQLLLLKTGLSTAANGVFFTDKFGRIQWLNAAFVAMTGYSEEEAIGATPGGLRQGHSGAIPFEGLMAKVAGGEAWCGETQELRKNGTAFSVRQTITPIRDSAGEITHFISILEDVTAMREAEAKIAHLAHYDLLTELPNRTLFKDHFRQALAVAKRTGERLALMFIDLDHFKHVNDTYGHNAGDLLLQQVAQRLRGAVRESDMVARLAGDEFTVLLPTVSSLTDATVVAEKLTAAFVDPFHLAGVRVQSGVSIGIALFPEHTDSEDSLLKCADAAMYVAKRAGRNGFRVFQPDMMADTVRD